MFARDMCLWNSYLTLDFDVTRCSDGLRMYVRTNSGTKKEAASTTRDVMPARLALLPADAARAHTLSCKPPAEYWDGDMYQCLLMYRLSRSYKGPGWPARSTALGARRWPPASLLRNCTYTIAAASRRDPFSGSRRTMTKAPGKRL
jgi:hypothetical protein